MSAGLEEIAQAVAVAVEDKALTERIYEKCMEKFDGETNTLWMHLEADSKVKAQGGWNKRVDAELGKGRKNATVKGIGNVDAAVKKFEKTVGAPLHLFWMYPSGWDKKTTPLVAFVPFDVNPKTRTSIPAFDAKGNSFELSKDGALAKKRPIIVITINERTQQSGKLTEGIFATSHESIQKKGTQNSSLIERKTPPSREVIQSHFLVKGTYISGVEIQPGWVDPDGEWAGAQEYHYECWEGFAPKGGGPLNVLSHIPTSLQHSMPNYFGPGNYQNTMLTFSFYETDFWPFSDIMANYNVVHPGYWYHNTTSVATGPKIHVGFNFY
jgi:hypothetical protein